MGVLNKDLRDKEGGKTGIKFYAGDVLYGKLRPYLMNWLYPQFNGVAVGDFWVLRATECDSSFLYRLVQTDSFQRLANVSSGSKMPRADWNLITQSLFAVPADHAEQKAIAKSLAELEDLITLHQRKCQSRSLCGYLSWEQRKLGELAHSFEYGLNAAAKPYDGMTKYLRITDIDDDTREFSQNDLTSPDVSDNVAREYSLHDGDLLFARTGASVGKTYLYQRRDGKTAFAGFLIRAVPNDDCDQQFLFQSTLGKGYSKYVAVTSQRSGQPGVNAAEYADWSLMAPSFDEQRQIGALFALLDNLITLHQ